MREVETKFRASRDLVIPALDGRVRGVASVAEPAPMRLVAVYHDTADLRLAREGVTLRRRTGGSDDGWHLKLPVLGAGAGVRDELQYADSGPAVPDDVTRVITAYLRYGRLQPAATLVTERATRLLCDEAGRVLAELVDDHVTVEGTGHVSAGFREIEVEDHGGGHAVLDAVGVVLRDAGAVSGEFMPKLVRALGARATAPPDPPLPEEMGPRAPAKDVLVSFLRTHVRRLMQEDVRFRLGGDDAVHQLRVASRRIRSVLRTCTPILDDEWSAPLREELSWLADELGGARDAEVLLARLLAELEMVPADITVGPVRVRLEQAIGSRLDGAVAESEKVLDSDRYITLLERLVDAAWSPRTTAAADEPAREVLPPLVRDDWRRLANRVAHAQGTGMAEDYHRVRIAAKRLRYASEAVALELGKPASRLAKQVERVQEVLGEHQDAMVSQETLRSIAASPAGRSVGFTLGLLYQREAGRALAARAEFGEVWAEVRRRRYRDWLAR